MEYKNFLEYIYKRHSPNVKLGLERMYDVLSRLGNPEKKLNGIHIAGTNGKGSTAAISEILFLSQGFNTGLNTSPHLVDYTERFRINGVNITSEEVMQLYKAYCSHFDDTEASFFEITTALAFQHFVDKKVDTAIFEVGLGGRLDGTNPFNSTVSIITSISFDHLKTLGNTIEKIAFEKAGIIKSGVPIVIGALPEKALNVILKQAVSLNAPYFLFDKDFFVENIRVSAEGTSFDYSFPKYDIKLKNLKLNLLGNHQAHNAALALTGFFIYLDLTSTLTKNVNNKSFLEYPDRDNRFVEVGGKDTIKKALLKINWQGRLQILSQKPLVVIDGAHNEEGVSTLIKNIKEIFPHFKYHFLVAILRDKKLDKMIREICSIAKTIYISKNHSDRAADIQDQVDVAIACGTKYFADDDLIESLKKCLSTVKNDDEMIVITGSLYTIAEILKVKQQFFDN